MQNKDISSKYLDLNILKPSELISKSSKDYLHLFFQEQALKFPNKKAVVIEDRQFTYSQIDQQSNQLAWYLKQNNISNGQYVAILTESNDLAFIAMLAILKAGNAYVPLDKDYPTDRINFILRDCKASLLISTSYMLNLHKIDCHQIALDQKMFDLSSFPRTSLDSESVGLTANSICYIIYTSGTTGRPKGVLIEHRSVCNYLQAAKQIYDLKDTDKVYQGFSFAFDASVEEIWLTFATGATLFTTNDKALKSGVGLVDFLNKNNITFFSTTPSLLAILKSPIPSLRLLVLGGEVCQSDLVRRWSREGLRIINTYGPTEATVVATYCEYNPQKPITIGKPFPNYEIFVLNSDLKPVRENEEGELCIGGVCLARGYINQPELNDSKFIFHLELGNKRLYRTGDLCKILPDGELQYLGRLDKQIKLRGFRIELNEIESVIMQFPAVQNAVVTVKEFPPGVESLIAYLILVDANNFDQDSLANFLKTRLPTYMIPSYYEIINKIPLLNSGKTDYKSLPLPQNNYKKENYISPKSEDEKIIAAAWKKIFMLDDISANADFFYDLGGHSLIAAQVVTLLRDHPKFSNLSMVDIYQYPTISKLALRISSYQVNNTQKPYIEEKKVKPTIKTSKVKYYLCACMQFLGSLLQFSIISWEFLIVITIFNLYPEFSLQTFSILASIIFLLPLFLLLFSIAMKWSLLGRIKPGEHKLWGAYYYRWWLFTRIQRTIAPVLQLTGSPLLNLYCRLMGAKIGKNCYIGTSHIYAFDLLTLGDNSSINQDAGMLGYTVENGILKIGSITIGKRCYVGTKGLLNINTQLHDDAILDDLSMLPANSSIPKGEHFCGSPAKKIRKVDEKKNIPEQTSRWMGFKYGIWHYLGLILIGVIYYASYVPGILIVDYFYEKVSLIQTIVVAIPLASLTFILLLCLNIIVLNRILVGKIKPNTYKIKSAFFVRKWIIERLMEAPEVEVLAETIYFPHFLRLLGAKIGKRVEVADLPHVTPKLFTLHDESFSAGSVMVGVPRIHLGKATYDMTEIGKRTFIGNSAVLPPGTKLGDYCLIGCLSIAPENINGTKSHTGWLGSPPVFLPRRETIKEFSDKLIFRPPKLLFLARASIELIRIILPTIFYFLILIGFFMSADYLLNHFSLFETFLFFPLLATSIIFFLAGIAIAIKWLLMGRYKPKVKPLWSLFIWKSDILERLHNIFIARVILEPLLGTPFAPCILRLLGAKIGKRAFINSSRGFAENDLINIGDDVCLNTECVMLTHLFEDRIFKMNYIKIGDGCSVGSFSEIIYSAVMENNSKLGSLSLLMKGEYLPANSEWAGIPSQSTIIRI